MNQPTKDEPVPTPASNSSASSMPADMYRTRQVLGNASAMIGNPIRQDGITAYLGAAIGGPMFKAKNAFGDAVRKIKETDVKALACGLMEWAKQNPDKAAIIAVCIILTACTPAILGAIGFSAGGIVAGSIAASIQAGIGNVAAGSLFAILTSAGMGGFGVPIVLLGSFSISNAVLWGGRAVWKWWQGRGGRNEGGGNGGGGNGGGDDGDSDDDEGDGNGANGRKLIKQD